MFLIGLFTGSYIIGALFTFFIVGFFAVLGGNSADLWKPFVCGFLWPVWLPLFLKERLRYK